MFLICFIAIIASYLVFLYSRLKHSRLYFVITAGVILALYAGLRGHEWGTDVASYIAKFENYLNYSFGEMLALFKTEIKDPFYHLVGWLFGRMLPYGQAWIAFIGIVYAVSICTVIHKESRNTALSFIMFLALGFFGFSLSGLRQTMAMSFITLAYFPLKNRKIIPFVLFVLIASLFHSSAIIFLVAYPLTNIKLGWFQIAIFGVATVMFVGFEGAVRELISNMYEESYLAGYAEKEEGLNFLGFVVQMAIFSFSLINYRSVILKHPEAKVLYNLSFISLTFQLYSSMIAEIFRVSMYFSVFNMLLVPHVIECEKNKKIKMIETVVIPLILIVYVFRNGIPSYTFFWG